jgi:hypothetical protein
MLAGAAIIRGLVGAGPTALRMTEKGKMSRQLGRTGGQGKDLRRRQDKETMS